MGSINEHTDQSAEIALPNPKRIITGHDAKTGKATIQLVDEGHWQKIASGTSKYNVFWKSQTMPVDINHDESLETEIVTGSLSLPNGTILRIVDRAPHTKGPMHRTQSLDYGIMVQGTSELLMDSGDRTEMQPGDVCIQRGTMHQWINNTDHWNRMIFVLMDALPLEVGDHKYSGETGLDHIKEIAPRSA
ncbi:cupin domain containing protein [Niveomyces insectorum RCEF 264]|uniref:Cupin domain containing protein n=1 Tax=Niveomyces insectorum RCEF 264 TaxID=1081102 RepID=A0A162MU10_9HYPO|nr:cupin domain containing protein [Niveomyces insectorum RCEF 264]